MEVIKETIWRRVESALPMCSRVKMEITINNIIGEKRIDLSHPIKGEELQLLACLVTMFIIGYRGL